jgi:hypothetical protein
MTRNVERTVNVHYAKSPIIGEWVVPWDELSDEQRSAAGHEARVHEGRFREQWRSDCVYIHELAPGSPIVNLGTGYSGEDSWVYEIDPTLPLELDPERGGHLISSRICSRARVIRCLHEPALVPELPSGRG